MASHVKQEALLGLIGAGKTTCLLCLEQSNKSMSCREGMLMLSTATHMICAGQTSLSY